LAAYLYRESAGNPFIITEVLAALRDQGRLIPAAAGWEWQGDVAGLTLPDRVQDIILQRTARLDETGYYLLTLAAAYGRPFDAALLAAAGECAPETATAALAEWQTRQLVRPVGAAWDFAHDNIRRALYQNVPAPLRRLLHARLAAALEAHTPAEVALLAYHADRAQRPSAVGYLLQAGDQARQMYAHEQALAAYRRGLELASAPELRYALLNGLENVYDIAGKRAEQRAALDALPRCKRDGPPNCTIPRQIE
jgi:predicted ATPase